ncbi:glycosyltransferase family 2 protein [Nocardioides sp. GCM10027113]|uniref:glycosyltransferase family 2 protein n=1 Tax=unclassified Nocardioides TaxID=2615069 RepID=UPI00360F072F
MLFTATTVKDSPANVGFFVAANLASGVDHMFVFLDAPKDPGQQEVAEMLDADPRVTCIRTGRKAWWGEDRPQSLNVRQRINANWARSALEPLEWVDWLFHVDGDEVALLDRAALDAVPEDRDAVWLAPLEAVSRFRPEARPTQFKRLLDDADLNLLHVLGAIDEPTNQSYFHGHVMGKSGVRPRSGLALTLHDAISPDGKRQERHRDDRLRLLHYDAVSGEEFIRKWTALAQAGPARYRASRQPMAKALKTLAGKDVPEQVREKYLRRIYELTTLDDVELLDELGLLERVDPERHDTAPRPMTDEQAAALAARVAELRDEPKRAFFVADAASDRTRDAEGRRTGSRGSRPAGARLKGLVRRG